MSRRTLPSLMALQCFEATVRHLSFTLASEELNLTQSAVSRQVRALEEFVGRPVFQRIKKRVVLTSAGEAYAAAIHDMLDHAERATLHLMAHNSDSPVLTVTMPPTFGTRWLVPRLGDFASRYPDIPLNLITHVRPFDFAKTLADVGFHFGSALWPGAVCHQLMHEEVVVVCAPKLLQGKPVLRDPQQIFDYTLLVHTIRPQSWSEWLRGVGVDTTAHQGAALVKGPRFEHLFMIIQAVVDGLGIAVLPKFLVEQELRSGQIVLAVHRTARSQHAYYLAYPASKADEHKVRVFREWVLAQAEQDSANEVV